MYVDEFPPNDMSRGMAASYGVRMAPTIQEALTLGTDHLDVDGVLIISGTWRLSSQRKRAARILSPTPIFRRGCEDI